MARQHRDGWQGDAIGPSGKRIRKQFSSQLAAEQWEKSFKAEGNGGDTLIDYVRPRVDMVWERGSKHGAKQFRHLQLIHKYMPCPMADINQKRVNDLISSLQANGDTGGTINRKLAALSKALKYAKDEGAYTNELPRFTRQREPRGRIRYLDWDEEKKLSLALSEFNPRYPDFVAFMCDTGVRCSNGIDLLWKDVKLPTQGSNQRGQITLWETKQGEPQTVPLSARAAEVLARQDRNESGPFKWLNPWTLRKHIKEAAISVGLGDDIVIHTFRHTCASRLVMQGVDIRRVQKFMGHKTITITLRYAHLAPKELESCVDALDMMGTL